MKTKVSKARAEVMREIKSQLSKIEDSAKTDEAAFELQNILYGCLKRLDKLDDQFVFENTPMLKK